MMKGSEVLQSLTITEASLLIASDTPGVLHGSQSPPQLFILP